MVYDYAQVNKAESEFSDADQICEGTGFIQNDKEKEGPRAQDKRHEKSPVLYALCF